MQCKCYVNHCQHEANLSFTFGGFLEFFPPNIFDPERVESTEAELEDTED